MKSERLFKQLKKQAATIEDIENRRDIIVCVDSTVSNYLRNKIKGMIRKEAEFLISDYQIGVIDNKEFDKKMAILRVVNISL